MNTAIPEGCKVLLACEGGWDVVFIRAMISHMQLPAMHARSIGGKSEFRASAVSVISMDPRFRELRAFGAILDADHDGDDPAAKTLAKINDVMRICLEANANFLGHGEVKPLKSGGFSGISVGAFVMPDGKTPGELEDMLLESVRKSDPKTMNCVDAFRECAHPNANAKAEKESKKMLQAFLSGLSEHCPDLNVALKKKAVNLDDDAFVGLRNFLQKLAAA